MSHLTYMKKQAPRKAENIYRQPKTFILLGIAIIVGGIILQWLNNSSKINPQPLDIFVVDSTMEYGQRTLQGIIRSDISSSGEGNYYLVLDDDRLIGIDKSKENELKKLLGKRVEISGELLEIPDLGVVGLMIPSSISEI